MAKTVIVIAGPTASGKSALALDVAEEFGGIVVNADSMQVYRELRILTARPDEGALARAPHALYGVLSVDERCSAARWREMALVEIAAAHGADRLPILVGGTGLYLRALMEGLSEVPEIPEPVRAATRDLFDRLGAAAFHAELARRDPAMAERLDPADRQRLIRAWEVIEASGRSLADWQAGPRQGPPAELRFATLVLAPPRAALYAACDRRFLAMIEAGALDEVRALAALGLAPDLPALKAVGVRELLAHISGETTLDEAITAAQTATRRFAKRQTTWLRHQLEADHTVNAQYSERLSNEIFSFIRHLC